MDFCERTHEYRPTSHAIGRAQLCRIASQHHDVCPSDGHHRANPARWRMTTQSRQEYEFEKTQSCPPHWWGRRSLTRLTFPRNFRPGTGREPRTTSVARPSRKTPAQSGRPGQTARRPTRRLAAPPLIALLSSPQRARRPSHLVCRDRGHGYRRGRGLGYGADIVDRHSDSGARGNGRQWDRTLRSKR